MGRGYFFKTVVDCEEPDIDFRLVRIFEAGSVLTAGFSLIFCIFDGVIVLVGFPHVYLEIDQSLHLITIASYDSLRQGRWYRLEDVLAGLRLTVWVQRMWIEDLEEIWLLVPHLFGAWKASWKAPAGTKNSSTGGVFHEVGCPAIGGTPYSHVFSKVMFFPECVARVPVSLWGSGG